MRSTVLVFVIKVIVHDVLLCFKFSGLYSACSTKRDKFHDNMICEKDIY